MWMAAYGWPSLPLGSTLRDLNISHNPYPTDLCSSLRETLSLYAL
jgi:hypothetical protein